MAQQLGMINVRGSVGDMTYVRTEDGYLIRRKSSLDKLRVLNDLKFEGSRRASKEFGAAANAGKLVRNAIIGTLKNAGDSKLQSRMMKKMYDILKTDMVSDLGERRPEKGRLEMLEGFEFNNKKELIHILLLQYRATIDRSVGLATISFPAIDPEENLSIPERATHFKLLSAVASLDFNKKSFTVKAAESDHLSLKAEQLPAFDLTQTFDGNGCDLPGHSRPRHPLL